jgi:hypothetical protein
MRLLLVADEDDVVGKQRVERLERSAVVCVDHTLDE